MDRVRGALALVGTRCPAATAPVVVPHHQRRTRQRGKYLLLASQKLQARPSQIPKVRLQLGLAANQKRPARSPSLLCSGVAASTVAAGTFHSVVLTVEGEVRIRSFARPSYL